MTTNFGRQILARSSKDNLGIVAELVPGVSTPGCLVCCSAPVCCPMCSALPCFDDAQYIKLKKESSKYVYIRENSIEWNEPTIIMKNGSCIGIDPCKYDVQDNITVVYFDDPILDRLSDRTRTCNELRTCLNGGSGERVSMEKPFCCDMLLRASSSLICCVPVCLPIACCPCALRHEIYLEDAQKGLYEIRKQRHQVLTGLSKHVEI